MTAPRPYNVKMLADRWSCTESHIYSLIRKGKIKTFRIGEHSIRILHTEVERFESCGLSNIEESGASMPGAEGASVYIPRTVL